MTPYRVARITIIICENRCSRRQFSDRGCVRSTTMSEASRRSGASPKPGTVRNRCGWSFGHSRAPSVAAAPHSERIPVFGPRLRGDGFFHTWIQIANGLGGTRCTLTQPAEIFSLPARHEWGEGYSIKVPSPSPMERRGRTSAPARRRWCPDAPEGRIIQTSD
jgi:hypothetical protein